SRLSFDYDARGTFEPGTLVGQATFAASEYIGATIGAGATGAIDTAAKHYTGAGLLEHVDLPRWGRVMDVAWMQDPRYKGTIDGTFTVEGTGFDSATMTIDGGGHITNATLFGGRLAEADVSATIRDGGLSGSFDGRFTGIHPTTVFHDDRFESSLS